MKICKKFNICQLLWSLQHPCKVNRVDISSVTLQMKLGSPRNEKWLSWGHASLTDDARFSHSRFKNFVSSLHFKFWNTCAKVYFCFSANAYLIMFCSFWQVICVIFFNPIFSTSNLVNCVSYDKSTLKSTHSSALL